MAINKKSFAVITAGLLVSITGVSLVRTAVRNDAKPVAKEEKKTNVATNIDVVDVMHSFEGKTDLKIRYIDTFAAMRESEEGIKISKELDQKRKELAKNIENQEKKLTQAMTDYRSKASMLSDNARSKEEQKLAKMKREYENMVKESEEELKLVMQQKTEQLGRQVDKAVAKVAQEDKLDAVIDRMSGRVIYASAKGDYTAKITQAINKEYSSTAVAKNGKTGNLKVASAAK
jgi:outer membrane protein